MSPQVFKTAVMALVQDLIELKWNVRQSQTDRQAQESERQAQAQREVSGLWYKTLLLALVHSSRVCGRVAQGSELSSLPPPPRSLLHHLLLPPSLPPPFAPTEKGKRRRRSNGPPSQQTLGVQQWVGRSVGRLRRQKRARRGRKTSANGKITDTLTRLFR